MRTNTSRLLALLALVLFAAGSPLGIATADDHVQAAPQCRFVGLWTEPTANFTTRIEGNSRWRTWVGIGPSVDESTTPASQGWLEVSQDRLTFDYDGHSTGFPYTFRFEDGCNVLRIDLIGTPTVYRFVRAGPANAP